MKRTKIHKVVFQMLVVMVVTSSLQMLLKNGSATKGGNIMGTKKISLANITDGDDSKEGVIKVKYFDDDGVDKIFENNNYSMASLLCGAIFIWKGCVFVGEGI